MFNLFEAVAGAALQNIATVVKPLAQRFRQIDHARNNTIHQHVHVHGNAVFKLALFEQAFHEDNRVHRAAARLQHDAHVFGRFVAHIREQRQLFLVEQVSDFFDQARLLHQIRNFGDDHHPVAAPGIFFDPTRAIAKAAAPGAVGFSNRLFTLDNNAAGRKIRALDKVQQIVCTGLRIFDQVKRCVTQFGNIMRRDRGCHAHRDALRAIGQQIREASRENHRLLCIGRVIVAEIDGVFFQPFQNQTRDVCHPRFCVAVGGSTVAVDIAEVTLPVHQGIARREILRQPHQRIINRLIAVRMEGAHHVANNFRAFFEGSARIKL